VTTEPLFRLGALAITPGALDRVQEHQIDVFGLLRRHLTGDWGELDSHDWRENDLALRRGGLRILSAYDERPGWRLWIITEADRSSTTVLRPEDY
jgi:hypothetical protein